MVDAVVGMFTGLLTLDKTDVSPELLRKDESAELSDRSVLPLSHRLGILTPSPTGSLPPEITAFSLLEDVPDSGGAAALALFCIVSICLAQTPPAICGHLTLKARSLVLISWL